MADQLGLGLASEAAISAVFCRRGRRVDPATVPAAEIERVKAELVAAAGVAAVDLGSARSVFEARTMVGQVLGRPLTEAEVAVVERDWRQHIQAAQAAARQMWD